MDNRNTTGKQQKKKTEKAPSRSAKRYSALGMQSRNQIRRVARQVLKARTKARRREWCNVDWSAEAVLSKLIGDREFAKFNKLGMSALR